MGDKLGQRVQVEVGGHNAPESAHLVSKRSATRNARDSLVVENVRRHPHESSGRLYLGVPRADARVVRAVELRLRQMPRAAGMNIVLQGWALSVHDPSLPDVLLAVGCAVGAREGARLVAIAHPA